MLQVSISDIFYLNKFSITIKIFLENRNELLYTIIEDEMSLSTRSQKDVEPTKEINESDRHTLRTSTPNTSTCPALQEFQNISLVPQQDSTNQLCSSNSVDSSFTNQDTKKKKMFDTREPPRLSNTGDDPLQKNKSISVELSALSLTKQQLQEYSDKYVGNYDYGTATSEASAATSEMQKSRVKVVPVERKSSERPKRKAALNLSLTEKSCKTKLV